MKVIVTVIGKDKVGIIAKVSSALSEMGANVEDISQTVMQGYFAMMMLVEVESAKDMSEIAKNLDILGAEVGVSIRIQHEDIFNAMHRI